jgi:hypothetical protein
MGEEERGLGVCIQKRHILKIIILFYNIWKVVWNKSSIHGATKKSMYDNDIGNHVFLIHSTKNVEGYVDGVAPHVLILYTLKEILTYYDACQWWWDTYVKFLCKGGSQ